MSGEKRGHTVLRYSLTDKVLKDNTRKLKIDNIEHVCLKQTYNQTKFFLNNMKTTFFNYNSTREYQLLKVFHKQC